MQAEEIQSLVRNTELLDDSSLLKLEEVLKEFPYFQTAALLRLKNLHALADPAFEEQLSKTAIFCADRRKLYYLVKDSQYERFMKDKKANTVSEDRTQALLDSFLNTISEEAETETALPDTETNMATYDYLAYLESVEHKKIEAEESSLLQHHQLIDRFIEKADSSPVFASLAEKTKNSDTYPIADADNEIDGDEFLTETLAKIYIRQKKYEQALTIIKRLSLNFPKKSVYFADQIRFLELLIINEKNKK